MMKLKKKQELFVQEYLACSNASQAARNAGYTSKRSDQAGYQLLSNNEVKKRIEELERVRYKELGITHRFVLDGLKRLAIGNEFKSPMVSVQAYKLLGEHLGTFSDKVDKTGERPSFVGVKIIMGDGKVKILGNDNKDLIDVKPNKALEPAKK